MMPFTPMSDFPVNDTRNVTDDRIHDDEQQTMPPAPASMHSARQSNVFISTANGDVETLVVDPSFDGTEKAGKEHRREASWQGVRATEMGKTAPPDCSSPEKDGKPATHARNLSAHFFDAATIKDTPSELATAPGVSFDDQSQRGGGYPTQHSLSSSTLPTNRSPPTSGVPPVSPAVGQKHSRAYSGDMSNPVYAHRRINSLGGGGVDRNAGNPYYPSYAPIVKGRHHREDSAGLDMLTAAIQAAGVPKEEMAKNAGVLTSPIRHPSAAPEAPREEDRSPPENISAMRTSPNEMGTVQYGYPQGGVMGAPQVRHPAQGANPHSAHSGYQQGPPYAPQAGFYPGQSFYAPGAPLPYGMPPQGYDGRQMPQGQPMGGYPMQYAPPRGQPHYSKAPFAPPTMATSSSSTDADMQHAGSGSMPYQAASAQWGGRPRPGTSTGVQTFVTTMAVGDGNKTMQARSYKTDPPSNDPAIPSTVGHHRKLSSFSSLSTIFQEGDQVGMMPRPPGSSYFHNPTDQSSRPVVGPPPTSSGPPAAAHHRSTSSSMSFLNSLDEKTVHGHHRSTSSSVSFLQGLDNLEQVFNAGQQDPLLQVGPNTSRANPYSPGEKGTHPSTQQYGGSPRPADPISSATCVPITRQASAPAPPPAAKKSSGRLAAGGTSKRVRRKCTIDGCPNRVVQGGRCISHGAKRKQCKHPGCTKNVKKAGLCSTHGPARKRCDAGNCQKVAVQGGRCIAHGAKKKLCDIDGCSKQAILSGMCKKHHDKSFGAGSGRRGSDSSARDPSPPLVASAPAPTVAASTAPAPAASASTRQAKRPSHTRGLSIFQEVSPENIQTLLSESDHQDQSVQGGQPDAFGRM